MVEMLLEMNADVFGRAQVGILLIPFLCIQFGNHCTFDGGVGAVIFPLE
jgi:hypothetical protein